MLFPIKFTSICMICCRSATRANFSAGNSLVMVISLLRASSANMSMV